MKIYFGQLLVKQRCFHLPYGCLISFVTHYYWLSSCAASSASLSLCLFLCSLRSSDHLAFASADEFALYSLQNTTCVLGWRSHVCFIGEVVILDYNSTQNIYIQKYFNSTACSFANIIMAADCFLFPVPSRIHSTSKGGHSQAPLQCHFWIGQVEQHCTLAHTI